MSIPVGSGDAPPVADVPAFATPSWLPTGTGWEELDEYATTHRRLLAARAEVVAEATAYAEARRREDAAYQEAMTSGLLSDGAAELPGVTPPEERAAARREFRERALALDAAMTRFISDAIAAIERHADAWLGDLANRRETAAERRREAERLLVEAREAELQAARLEHWTKLNGGKHERQAFRIPEMRYVTWAHVESSYAPPPSAADTGDDRPTLVDPPSLPYWDESKRAALRKIAAEDADPDAPHDEAEALRRAVELPPDPNAQYVRQSRIAEVAAGLDSQINDGRLNLRRG